MRLTFEAITSTEYPDKMTLGDLLRYKEIELLPWLFVSVNNVFIKKEHFDTLELHENDRIDLVYFAGGG